MASLVLVPSLVGAVVGDPDISFGENGTVVDAASGSEAATGVVLQPDGRIVVAGRALNADGNYDFLVARYTTTGAPDASFGTNGKTTTGFAPTATDFAYAVALYPPSGPDAGKIVVAGVTDSPGRNVIAVARYTAAGVLDPAFNSTGARAIDVGAFGDQGLAVALQADGKVVIAGSTSNGTDDD
ncbi:MAG: delta-60 repeat domain-containing protein, partial [Acidimicrobiales bacterium]